MGLTIKADNVDQIAKKLGNMQSKTPKVLRLAINDTARKAKQRLAAEAQKKIYG